MSSKQSVILARLAAGQNRDGGWAYKTGSSWTEPTAFALLALSTRAPQYRSEIDCGRDWLRRVRLSDGGWAPQPGIDRSTWVTALPLLLPQPPGTPEESRMAAQWLIRQTPANSTWVYRLQQWMLGANNGVQDSGWSWFPDTAAWVTPTALTILALAKSARRDHVTGVDAR